MSLGLKKGSRSPSAIVNEQHHDPSGAARGIPGMPGSEYKIVSTEAASAAGFPVLSRCIVRVLPSAAGQFVWIGDQTETPPVTLDATNSIALSGDSRAEHFHMGDDKKIRVSAGAQVVVFL